MAKTEKFNAVFNPTFSEFQTEDIGFLNFPPLEGYFGEIQFSKAYQTLLYQNISGFSTTTPLLATISDGNRRVAVLLGENSWKWRMLSKVNTKSFKEFDTFFSKLIQYISSNKQSDRLKIQYKPFVYANKDVIIQASFFDANYQFDDSTNIVLSLHTKKTNQQKNYPFTLKNNSYQIQLSNLKPGDYEFTVSTNNHKFKKSGKFTILPYAIEQQLNTANTKALKRIASTSKGSIFYPETTDRLFENLHSDKRYHIIQKSTENSVSLFDLKWVLGILLFFFSLEWFIRKYRGFI